MSEKLYHILGALTAVLFLLLLAIAQILNHGNDFSLSDCLLVFVALCLYKIITIKIGYKKKYISRQAWVMPTVNVLLFVVCMSSTTGFIYFKYAYFVPLILSADLAMHTGEIVRAICSC